jgi:capsular exopolysaccharide synthesis family protein
VNRDIALTEGDDSWPMQRYIPSDRPAGEHTKSGLDFAMLLRIMGEWRWLLLGALAIGLALGVIYTLLSTPLYRSWVTLEVNPPTVEVSTEENAGSSASSSSIKDVVATQVGLLQSRGLAERVAEDLNLASKAEFVDPESRPAKRLESAAERVQENLVVIPPAVGTLIRFSYISPSPQTAQQVANGVADAFINSTLQRRYEASTYARNFLQRQIAKTRGDLERSERLLVAYAQSQGIINTAGAAEDGGPAGDTASPSGESLLALNRALADATARRVALEGAYRASVNSGPTVESTQSTQQLRAARAGLESQFQEKRNVMKAEHPEMVSLRARIAELDKQIGMEGAAAQSGRTNTLLADYRGAVAAERALTARVAQLKGDVLNLRGRSIQYTILQREVDTNRALYDALLQRYKEIGVAGGIGSAPVSVVDRADVPAEPFKPSLIINLVMGAIVGLIAGLAAAVGLEFLNDTIDNRDDVRKKLGLACLGVIPKRGAKESYADDLRDPTSAVSEAYSTVVTSLGFSTEHGMPRTLLLTSARPSEGKSSSSLAIAQNFARRGSSVLLIDSDLRKPAFKGPNPDRGMTKLLTNEESISDHLTKTQYPNLSLLPSGPIPPNPADLLSTGRFRAILREASSKFDIVIVDAPPTLGLADAPLLAAMVKDVMVVIESGKTRTGAAMETVRSLRASGAHIVGATLTKAAEQAAGYGYGYGYGYGHKYGKVVDKKRTEIFLIPDEAGA